MMDWLVPAAQAMGVGGGSGGSGSGGGLMGLLPLVLMFAIFYFLLIRPQQKKAKTHREMLNNLKRGDSVITTGGIYGRIAEIKDTGLILEVGEKEKIQIKLAKGFIHSVGGPGQEPPPPPAK
jgi:preprotein translocase subunit YajC